MGSKPGSPSQPQSDLWSTIVLAARPSEAFVLPGPMEALSHYALPYSGDALSGFDPKPHPLRCATPMQPPYTPPESVSSTAVSCPFAKLFGENTLDSGLRGRTLLDLRHRIYDLCLPDRRPLELDNQVLYRYGQGVPCPTTNYYTTDKNPKPSRGLLNLALIDKRTSRDVLRYFYSKTPVNIYFHSWLHHRMPNPSAHPPDAKWFRLEEVLSRANAKKFTSSVVVHVVVPCFARTSAEKTLHEVNMNMLCNVAEKLQQFAGVDYFPITLVCLGGDAVARQSAYEYVAKALSPLEPDRFTLFVRERALHPADAEIKKYLRLHVLPDGKFKSFLNGSRMPGKGAGNGVRRGEDKEKVPAVRVNGAAKTAAEGGKKEPVVYVNGASKATAEGKWEAPVVVDGTTKTTAEGEKKAPVVHANGASKTTAEGGKKEPAVDISGVSKTAAEGEGKAPVVLANGATNSTTEGKWKAPVMLAKGATKTTAEGEKKAPAVWINSPTAVYINGATKTTLEGTKKARAAHFNGASKAPAEGTPKTVAPRKPKMVTEITPTLAAESTDKTAATQASEAEEARPLCHGAPKPSPRPLSSPLLRQLPRRSRRRVPSPFPLPPVSDSSPDLDLLSDLDSPLSTATESAAPETASTPTPHGGLSANGPLSGRLPPIKCSLSRTSSMSYFAPSPEPTAQSTKTTSALEEAEKTGTTEETEKMVDYLREEAQMALVDELLGLDQPPLGLINSLLDKALPSRPWEGKESEEAEKDGASSESGRATDSSAERDRSMRSPFRERRKRHEWREGHEWREWKRNPHSDDDDDDDDDRHRRGRELIGRRAGGGIHLSWGDAGDQKR